MVKKGASTIVAITAVAAVVAAAAWVRSNRSESPAAVAAKPAEAEPAATVAKPAEAEPTAVQTTTQSAEEAGAEEAIAEEPKALPRLVDLGANKCKQCIALAPILDALREEYKGRLTVEFIDVWKHPDAAGPYNIRVIPTQILYDAEGKELWRHEGFIEKESLKKLFAEKAGVK